MNATPGKKSMYGKGLDFNNPLSGVAQAERRK